MTKHIHPRDLDDEQRALFTAVRHLDQDDYEAHYRHNMAKTSYGQDWGFFSVRHRCVTCNRAEPKEHNGYCYSCRPETYEGD